MGEELITGAPVVGVGLIILGGGKTGDTPSPSCNITGEPCIFHRARRSCIRARIPTPKPPRAGVLRIIERCAFIRCMGRLGLGAVMTVGE